MPKDSNSATPEDDKPKEGLESLRPFFDAAEVDPPEDLAKSATYLRVKSPVDEMASTVANFLRGKNMLFRRGATDVVTIDEDTGDQRLMTPNRLRTWLPSTAGLMPIARFDAESGKPWKSEIEPGQAAAILASDELLFKLPVIEAVNPVSMPIYSDELDERGLPKLMLSPLGYHAPTKSYTIHQALPYQEDMDPQEACKFFKSLFGTFPMDARSMSVHMAAMLTVFCRRLFVGRTPMFLYNSNMGGSGKSTLAETVIAPVYGRPGSTSYDQFQQKDVKSDLDSIGNTYKPYVLFDDFELPPDVQLKSNHLNRWLTCDIWESRTFGKNTERREIPIEAVTLMTGIKFNLEGQLRRRTLFIDLFLRQSARERELPEGTILITSSFIRNPERRAELLAAMWALVRFWDENDRRGYGAKALESFEDWSEVVPAIVHPGFGDCLQAFEAPDAGDLMTTEFTKLATALIQRHCVDAHLERCQITMRDVIRTARLEGLFTKELWTLEQVMAELEQSSKFKWRTTDASGEPILDDNGQEKTADELTDEEKKEQAAEWSNQSINSAWGKAFKRGAVDGQYFRVDGRFWEFGKRGSARGSTFELAHVAAPE